MTDDSVAEIVEQFYENWAVMSCDESRRCLIQSASTLGSILFAINIDKFDFNFTGDEDSGARGRKKESEDPGTVSPVYSSSPAQVTRKITPRIVCLADEDGSYDSDSPMSRQLSNASYSSTPNAAELDGNNKLMLTPLEEDVRSVSGLSTDDRTSNDLDVERELTSSDEVRTSGDEKEPLSQDAAQEAVTRLREERDKLLSQLQKQEETHEEQLSRYEALVQDVTKENEILKAQVRNYLSAIQMIKSDSNPELSSEVQQQFVPSYVLEQEVRCLH